MTDENPQYSDDLELLVAEIAEDFLKRLENGESPHIEEYTKRHPDIAEMLNQVLSVLSMVGTSSDIWRQVGTKSDPVRNIRRVLGDFKIIREVGRGGMGVVYEAQELSLGRRVALKVLPFAAVLDPRQLERFKMEAQVAAQLHHTNIVPVYSVGCERGVHYYSMQFVEGQSLIWVIKELRKLSDVAKFSDSDEHAFLALAMKSCSGGLLTSGSTKSSEFIRSAVQIGIQAAEALQHAHNMGVVHRDIKPSNLLLDALGHLWITDFGLAQYRTNTTSTLTMPGDILGTIRYMSPEQASGGTAIVDHRTDIYSLGATLYELLTLEPVYRDLERHKLLHSIEVDEPCSLRRLNPAVPRDLETIILKSMAKGPSNRYANSQKFADDLRRFLEHRTIRARRPTLGEYLSKWSRRHRPIVVATMLILIMTVLVLSISTVLIWQEKARTEAALEQTNIERKRAKIHYEKAREAIDEIAHIVEYELASPAAVQKTRRELLLKAQGFFQSLLEANSIDPVVMTQTAIAYKRIGEIHMRLGQYSQAESAHRMAIKVCEKLMLQTSNDHSIQILRADCATVLCSILQELGNIEASVDVQHQAIKNFEQILALFPNNPDYQLRLANEQINLGTLLIRIGQRRKGLQAWTQGIGSEHLLAIRHPEQFIYQEELASDLSELARTKWNIGQRTDALEHAHEAVIRFEQLAVNFPDQLKDQTAHVRIRMTLASKLRSIGKFQEADEQLAAAKVFQQQLCVMIPEDPMHIWFLAWNIRSMGLYQEGCGRTDEAIELYQQANQFERKAIVLSPYNAEFRRSHALNCCGLGRMLTQQVRFQEAEQALYKGKEMCEQLLSEVPNRFENTTILTRIFIRLADLRQSQGKEDQALNYIRQARQLQDELVKITPNSSHWSWRYGEGWGNTSVARNYILMANTLFIYGHFKEATELYLRSTYLRIWQDLAEKAAQIQKQVGSFLSSTSSQKPANKPE